jgi:hypothetical protein
MPRCQVRARGAIGRDVDFAEADRSPGEQTFRGDTVTAANLRVDHGCLSMVRRWWKATCGTTVLSDRV